MLKNAGREKKSKKGEYIKCRECKEKIYVNEAIEDGYIEKISGVTIINCPFCDCRYTE